MWGGSGSHTRLSHRPGHTFSPAWRFVSSSFLFSFLCYFQADRLLTFTPFRYYGNAAVLFLLEIRLYFFGKTSAVGSLDIGTAIFAYMRVRVRVRGVCVFVYGVFCFCLVFLVRHRCDSVCVVVILSEMIGNEARWGEPGVGDGMGCSGYLNGGLETRNLKWRCVKAFGAG